MQANHTIWSYLADLRRLQRISQQETADAVGMTRLAWGQIERGETEDPRASVLIGAMRHLGGS